MLASISVLTSFTILLFSTSARCQKYEETLKELKSILSDVHAHRQSRDIEDISDIWQKYKFWTEVGNREELVVTNISVHEDVDLPSGDIKWQFLDTKVLGYLLGRTESAFTVCKFDAENVSTECIEIETNERIFASKIINLSSRDGDSTENVIVILYVEQNRNMILRWYAVHSENFEIEQFWALGVHGRIKSIEYIRQENLHKLLLLYEGGTKHEQHYQHFQRLNRSSIYIYNFTIDLKRKLHYFHYCDMIIVPTPVDIQVCSVQENAILAVQGPDNIQIFEDSNDMTRPCSSLQPTHDIKSNNLNNSDCFESGYVEYFAVSGPEAGLFSYLENEYQYNEETGKYFDEIPDVTWMKSVRVNTYREESLLLMQLKNSTVIALAWHQFDFKRVPLPSQELDKFDLSKVTAIPRFGFISGNVFVRIDTALKDLPRPMQKKMERMIGTKVLLEEILNKQEHMLDKVEEQYNKSYYKNPVVTGFWNISTLVVNDADLSNVTYRSLMLGNRYLTPEDLRLNISSTLETLNDFEETLKMTESKLNDTFSINSTDIDFDSDIDIFGDVTITGTMHVKKLSINDINGIPVSELLTDYVHDDDDVIIRGRKTFPSLDSESFRVDKINNIPVEEISFSDHELDYHAVNFSQVNQLVVEGNLDFETLNGVNWTELMMNVVWKNEAAIIPGETIIKGEASAENIELDNLNGLSYPDGYVLEDIKLPIQITASKNFTTLNVLQNADIRRINGIDIDDFIVLNKNNVLTHEITFQNLTVDVSCQVDGRITGIDLSDEMQQPMLNESRNITADIIFANLTVLGEVTLENSLNGKTWSDFDDLLLRTDEKPVITGRKIFLQEVVLGPGTVIESGIINGHPIEEFVTTDTEQELPNLRQISADVTFDRLIRKDVERLKEYLRSVECLDRPVRFEDELIVDELVFTTLNGNITYEHYMERFKDALEEVHFENLSLEYLEAEDIRAEMVLDLNLTEMADSRITREGFQHLTGEYVIDNLQADTFDVEYINGMSLDEFNDLRDELVSMYRSVFEEDASASSLTVTGMISANTLNGLKVQDIWQNRSAKSVVFENDIYVENLTILGAVDGFNFSELLEDTVLKTDDEIVVTGHKRFNSIDCKVLEAQYLNGHSVDNIFDPSKEQVLTGPVLVKGSVTVLQSFDSSGKIGDVPYRNLTNRFKWVDNNTLKLHGDFKFARNASVNRFSIDGDINGVNVKEFLQDIVYKDDENIIITGSKTFENSVTFKKAPVIEETLNELDLKRFYSKSVAINKPFSVRAEVIFEDDIVVENDLVVGEHFEAGTIMGVDLKELEENALYKSRPTSVIGSMTFANVTFQSNVKLGHLNDVDMSLLIPLHTEQTIFSKRLKGVNVTVENLQVDGNINGYTLDSIYKNTLMTTGDQNVTGHIIFRRGVHVRRDFLANQINGISPKRFVTLDSNETIKGNFVFEKPVSFNGNLRILGQLNNIDLLGWKTVAIQKNPEKQIVSGKWKVHGDVYFEKEVEGDGLLDGVNVTELISTVREEATRMQRFKADTERTLIDMCSDVNELKQYAANQIYMFNTFDYAQILNFDLRIKSVHFVESEDVDYLLISHETCNLDMFAHNGTEFEAINTFENFGSVDRWITLQYGNVSYIVTISEKGCGRGLGNLWALKNYAISHVYDLGNVTDVKKVDDDTFLTLRYGEIETISIGEIISFAPQTVDNGNYKFVVNSDRILFTENGSIFEFDGYKLHKDGCYNNFGSSEVISLKVGIFRREMLLHYGESVSDNEIFIYDGQAPHKYLQSIKAHKPKSVIIINFEGNIETLIIFIEKNMYIQIYEYKGVLGFVYRDTIKLNADKLFYFKRREHRHLVKRNYVAAVHASRLFILEAKMYGEKLDAAELSCPAK